jgi:adenylosuccinate lyase
MRQVWSEVNKRRLWRKLWVALAKVQAEFGLVAQEQVEDLCAHADSVDIERSLEIEAEIQHDLMAELKTFAEQAPTGGSILHLGATSMDIEDNADVLRMRQSLEMILESLHELLLIFAAQIDAWADTPLIAFTHIQPAEPSTLGYRLAIYAQDLLMDWEHLNQMRADLHGKGFRGAVGTSASYADLIGEENLETFERRLSEELELEFFPVTTQVYPRKQDFWVLSALAGLGASLYKFAFDLRILQSPPIGELSEPFGDKQVGSSAMPFKRNPINAEKIDSLARALAQMPRLAWDNAAHSLLERTLDDSANRRTLLPEAFLIADELLQTASRILKGLSIRSAAMARNLSNYAPFAAVERVLLALVKAGADRQEMHEHLRKHAMEAWGAIQTGESNPLSRRIITDPQLQRYLSEADLDALMQVNTYLGDAAQRARYLAAQIRMQAVQQT